MSQEGGSDDYKALEAKQRINTPLESHEKLLYVVRHGQSEYNQRQRQVLTWLTFRCCSDPGLRDPQLTATGARQANRLRAQLLQCFASYGHPDMLVSSPLRRAVTTACLAVDDLPLNVTADCAEVMDTLGDVGSALEDLQEGFNEAFPNRKLCRNGLGDRWWHFDSKSGPFVPVKEPKTRVQRRTRTFLQYLSGVDGRCAVCVSHGSFIRQMLQLGVMGKPKNCCGFVCILDTKSQSISRIIAPINI